MEKQYTLVILDGAADLHRTLGRSPLALARTNGMDWIAREGASGLMQTLYPDLPKDSLVSQMGMLGWDPHLYYAGGRASCELLALGQVPLEEGDLAFRANIVRMKGRTLASYNGDYITTKRARALIHEINRALRIQFPEFELYHNQDFRNTLVVRGANIEPELLVCVEPHENQGRKFQIDCLISGRDPKSSKVARRINRYLGCVARLFDSQGIPYMVFPWSASKAFRCPAFRENTRFDGPVAIVGCMDFLHGLAKAGEIEFFRVGDGRPTTDYHAKGAKVLELLAAGYRFVVCHINAPDEATHMKDLELKVKTLELIDQHIVTPLLAYFQSDPAKLGAIMVVPDHYTNLGCGTVSRAETHSLHPVPFAYWNQRDHDEVYYFSEDDAQSGLYGHEPVNHLQLLRVLGVQG